MTFEVETAGASHRVDLAGSQVSVDGRRYDVDAARSGHLWSLLVRGRSHEVAVDETPDGLIVHVNGRAVAVNVRQGFLRPGGRGRIPNRESRVPGTSGPRHVIAPMPGRVLKVLVKVGDTVSERQGLVVVEAMKMENELRASSAGTVKEIRAVEGLLVDANAILIVLE